MSWLDELNRGSKARVLGFSEDSVSVERLAALGFLPGVEVSLLRLAPLGDPLVYRVGERQVSLRRADARCVSVTDADSADAPRS